MEVKLLVSRGGVGFAQNAGDVITVGDKEGVRMIEAGQAVPVREAKRERTTKKPKVEKAVK